MSETMNRGITKQRRDHWQEPALGAMTLICFLIIGLNGCSSGSPSDANTSANTSASTSKPSVTPPSTAVTTEASPPVSLSDAGEYGENIDDYAKAKHWK